MACVAKAISGEAAGADGSVTLPDLERYVKKQYSDRTDLANVHPQMHNNTTSLFPLIANSLATDQMENSRLHSRRSLRRSAVIVGRLVSHPQDAMALAQKSRLISYQAEQFRNYSRMNEAMSAAESAVQAAPNESLPYIARANAYRINKQYEKAFADASTPFNVTRTMQWLT
ncbi:MAG: hypothetical protein U0930_02375 [Pirellulales bacterium]